MSFLQVARAFQKCYITSGRNAKMSILTGLLMEDGVTFRQAVEYAKNPMWIYHMKAPSVAIHKEDGDPELAWRLLRLVLDKLRKKEISANNKTRNQIASILASAPGLCAKWMAEIMNGSLKIGIQDFDHWFPGIVPESPVMLCEKWDGETLLGTWALEPKFDGYRALVLVDSNGDCEVLSRGSKEFWNWEHIAAEIKVLGLRDVVMDGEFYAGNFGLTSSICKSQKGHKQAAALKFYVFDLLKRATWDVGTCLATTRERQGWLAGLVRAGRAANGALTQAVVVVKGRPVHTVEDIGEAVDELYGQGFEGGVLKNQDAPYVCRRSDQWLKVKPQEECDIRIVDALEGKGRHKGRLGAFIVEGVVVYKKQKHMIRSRVGGGLSDLLRNKFWHMHKRGKLVGTVIEVQYQDVTTETSMGENCMALRFSRFVRVRDDKTI